MALTYGFFNSQNGDRKYNADDMSEYFNGLVSDGVYESVGNAMVVTAGSGMSVNVGSGRALINCKWLKNDSSYNVIINPANASNPRYTAVCIALSNIDRNMSIVTIDGTPSSSPVKPTPPTSPLTQYLVLAYVYVPANASSISQANITDQRGSSLCPWVTGLIEQVDTSQLFLQYQTAYENQFEAFTNEFNSWFDTLTAKLNVNTYIQEYTKRAVLSSGTSNIIPLDMTGYTYDSSDIVSIYINGLYAAPDVDYLIDTRGSVPELHPNASASGTEIYISILKSKIGFNALTTSDGNNVVTSNNEVLSI